MPDRRRLVQRTSSLSPDENTIEASVTIERPVQTVFEFYREFWLPYRKSVLNPDTRHPWYASPRNRPISQEVHPMSDTYRRYRVIKQAIMQF